MSSNEPNRELDVDADRDKYSGAAGQFEDEASSQAVDEALQQELDASPQETQAAAPPSAEQRAQAAEREVLRARADLENYRKRMQRDSEQQLKYANVPLVRDLIEVVDNLNRAMEAASQDAANASALRDGVGMVLNQLATVLSKYGCKQIESVGHEFDPNVHEAIAQLPSEEHAVGIVSQEVAAGYLLHDRVVRPSSVIVSSGPTG